MTDKSENIALDALLAAAATIAPEFGRETLANAYAIEKAYQFEDDNREAPIRSLQKLAEDVVDGSNR